MSGAWSLLITFAGILLTLIIVGVLLDLLVRRVFRFPKAPHKVTPEGAGISFEEVRFPTRKGRQLFGWWVPAPADGSEAAPTVILVHGWGRNLARTMRYIEELHPRGYHLLAFDLRGHGSSGADDYPNMLKFSEDIRAAIDYLETRSASHHSPVKVIGLSVGGAAAIHAAAMDSRIRGVVTVGAFAHPVDAMRAEFQKRRVPGFPLVWLLTAYLQIRMNLRFHRIAPENVIGRAAGRFLLVHGEEDEIVPIEQGERLRSAADSRAVDLWSLPGRGHSDCHEHPGFWGRVDSFLRGSIPDAESP
ncbi:MAG: alpha/beta fold hydrolase [Gemmatimonadetes bacterium]|nr:alpha/beta fold hydrolase [Gemmatimonadota bacterium]